jgi:hypothetical protein
LGLLKTSSGVGRSVSGSGGRVRPIFIEGTEASAFDLPAAEFCIDLLSFLTKVQSIWHEELDGDVRYGSILLS